MNSTQRLDPAGQGRRLVSIRPEEQGLLDLRLVSIRPSVSIWMRRTLILSFDLFRTSLDPAGRACRDPAGLLDLRSQ